MAIKAGDLVRLKPEWMDEADENIVLIALQDEHDGMVEVEAQIDLPFKPTQIIETHMIEGN